MKCIWSLALLPAAAVCALAQAPPPRPPSVEATGNASVQAKPDQAMLTIGVVTQAPTAQEAASQNAAQLQATIEKLRPVLGTAGTLKTVGYSLNPVYSNPREGSQPTIKGYSATNMIEVTTSDLAGLGKLIDAAAQGGANRIQNIEFTVKDDTTFRAEALRKAVQAARANAEAMAAALGLKAGKVLLVQEGGNTPIRPLARQFAAAAVVAPTPVETGTIEVSASVTLTMQLE